MQYAPYLVGTEAGGLRLEMQGMATKEKEEAETEREGAPDGPLLDLSDDAVKKMIKLAKKRGYVTLDELNAVLPSEET
jgi:RNA polymerase primary sigma factor